MISPFPIRRCGRPSEAGYVMISVMFLLALLVIALAVAAPRVKSEIQRDREVETMHRGKQYIRAIQLYYRKFHAYPPTIDALVKTQEIRFLRKKYIDPTTGKEEWTPVHFGQNKTPTAMGFFGQPLAGASIGGIGPSGGNGLNGTSGFNGQAGSNSPFGSNSNGSSSIFGNNSSSFGSNSSSFGSNSFGSSSFGSNGNGSSGIFSSSDGSNPGSPSGAGSGVGANGAGSSSSSDPNGGSGSGPGNGFSGTFGGAGIIGVSPGSPKQSILVYKKKNHYNEWEFTYDPAMEPMTMGTGGAGLGAQPMSGTSTPIGGNSGFGNNPQSGFGNNSTGFGNNNTSQPQSTPQQ
jgi:type II secretory pathway pseudopilin PulG